MESKFLDIVIAILSFITGTLGAFGIITFSMKNKTINKMIQASWIEFTNSILRKRVEQLQALDNANKEIVLRVKALEKKVTWNEMRVDGISEKMGLTDDRLDDLRYQMRNMEETVNRRMDKSDELNKQQVKLLEQMIEERKEVKK